MSSDRAPVNSRRVMIAAAWAIISRWGMRLLGLVSTLVLARLLAPEDFGIIGMAMIVVGFSEAILEFGVRAILIHRDDLTRDDYDTAWTLNLLQGAVAATIVASAAFPAVEYFNDPRLMPVLLSMAGGMLLGATMNIGVVDFQRNLDMRRDFALLATKKLASVVISIVIAIVLQSYWAMVFGFIGMRVAECVASYVMHPYRPRLSLSRFSEFFGFSAWMMVRGLGRFARRRTDSLIVASSMGTVTMGFYTIASSLTGALVGEIVTPAARALFPAYAAMKHDPERLRHAAKRTIGTLATLSLPVSLGLALVAHDMVLVVLGEKWQASSSLLQLLALAAIFPALTQSVRPMLIGLGRVAAIAIIFWLQVGVLLVLWSTFYRSAGADGVAMARLGAGFFAAIMIFGYTVSLRVLGFIDILAPLLRPIAAAGAMVIAVTLVQSELFEAASLLSLTIEISVGALAYTVVTIVLWLAAGRPDGLESMVAARVARLFPAR